MPDETELLMHCKSKKFIKKVMFIAAVERPILDSNKTKWLVEKMEYGILFIQKKMVVAKVVEIINKKEFSKTD